MTIVETEMKPESESGAHRAKLMAEALAERGMAPPEIELTVRVRIDDAKKLTSYARHRMRAAMGDPTARPANIGEAALQAIVECNENPTPNEYGVAIVSTHYSLKLPEHGLCSVCRGVVALKDAVVTPVGLLVGKECGCQAKV